jgi:3-oxoacyl-[acyl-carrier protein] reductase
MSITTALVTGAASGVGRECTRVLLDRGCRVAAVDLRADSVISALPDAGSRLHAIGADIGDPVQCARAVAEAVNVLGGIDAFLHFAALWVGTAWDESQPPEWDRIIGVNVKGTFFLAQAVARHMTESGRGSIVLTTSDAVNVGGVAGGPAYVASKGAVVGLTHCLAKALGPKGVRVNAVSPGVIDTPMTTAWPQAVKDGAVAQTPLGRLAVPQDVAGVACFLASDESRFVTGEIIEVNGGFYFR